MLPVELAGLEARCASLAADNEGLWGEVSRLLAENERLRGKVASEGELEEARRAGKRQAGAVLARRAFGESASSGSSVW